MGSKRPALAELVVELLTESEVAVVFSLWKSKFRVRAGLDFVSYLPVLSCLA